MKDVDIISKVVARRGEAMASPSKGAVPPVDLSGYLLKEIWDKVFEIRTDSNGTEYIFGKLPVVTQYGITMYGLDENLDIPSIYAGIPVDGTTITKREDGTLMVNPNIELGGASNWDELEGKPSWITDSKPKYNYNEIEGAPDLGNYALRSDVTLLSEKLNDFLEGSDTDTIINKWKELEVFLNGLSESDNLATILQSKVGKDYVDGNFVTLATTQPILGEKDFTGGLKVNGSPIYYDTEKKYWKFEGDLLVTGGVTMYGNDSEFIPSTIMDAIQTDGVTIRVNPTTKNLEVIGNLNGATTLGGLSNVGTWADSVADVDRIMYQAAGSSNWVAKSLSSIGGGGGVSGDYLPLSGGVINSTSEAPLILASTAGGRVFLELNDTNGLATRLGKYQTYSFFSNLYGGENRGELQIHDDGSFICSVGTNNYTLWHSGNDGSGSGLDADLLDGKHADSFMIFVANNNYVGASMGNEVLSKFASGDGYIEFWDGAGGWFNGKWGKLIAVSGFEGSLSGNASSATKLRTARTIWGQSFDGTGNVSGSIQLDGGELLMYSSNHLGTSAWKLFSYGPTLQLQYGDGYSTASNTSAKFNNDGSINVYKLITYQGVNNRYSMFDENGIACYTTSTGGYAVGVSIYAHDGSFAYSIINAYGSGSTLNYIFIGGVYNNPWVKIDTSANMLVKGGITMYSDKRKKTILNHVELSLKQIAEAPLVEHYYNSDDAKTTHVGSIAQYWASMNDWFCKLDSEGYYTMEIQNCALASAISIARELDRYETKTDKAIKKLKKRICELEEEVERLKSA